jgi:hypothetical protein
MGTLLDRIKGIETTREMDPDFDPEFDGEIPDSVPPEWAGLTPDPAPVPRKGTEPLVPKVYAKITPALKKRISSELEVYIELMAMPIVMRDPVCGGAIHEQAKPMADAIAQILSRHPEIASKFLATGMIGDWLKLLAAVQPIASAVWAHHITSTPEQAPGGDGFDLNNFDPNRPGV